MTRLLVTTTLTLLLSISVQTAYACPDCDDEVCIAGICGCFPNVGRCPPKLAEPERFPFCNITNDTNPGANPSCTNCSSVFSGDAGKADCAVRHQGNYVKSGACVASECGTVQFNAAASLFSASPKTFASKKSPAPELMRASKVQIEELTTADGEAKAAKATALLTSSDGTQLRCSYEMSYQPSKSKTHKGIQFIPKSETCSKAK